MSRHSRIKDAKRIVVSSEIIINYLAPLREIYKSEDKGVVYGQIIERAVRELLERELKQ